MRVVRAHGVRPLKDAGSLGWEESSENLARWLCRFARVCICWRARAQAHEIACLRARAFEHVCLHRADLLFMFVWRQADFLDDTEVHLWADQDLVTYRLKDQVSLRPVAAPNQRLPLADRSSEMLAPH